MIDQDFYLPPAHVTLGQGKSTGELRLDFENFFAKKVSF